MMHGQKISKSSNNVYSNKFTAFECYYRNGPVSPDDEISFKENLLK
jgi:hypothetical protein